MRINDSDHLLCSVSKFRNRHHMTSVSSYITLWFLCRYRNSYIGWCTHCTSRVHILSAVSFLMNTSHQVTVRGTCTLDPCTDWVLRRVLPCTAWVWLMNCTIVKNDTKCCYVGTVNGTDIYYSTCSLENVSKSCQFQFFRHPPPPKNRH